MQDIFPPGKLPKSRPPYRRPMRSARLQGHSQGAARARLLPAKQEPPAQPEPNDAADDIPTIALAEDLPQPSKRRLLRRPRPMDWWRNWSRRRKIFVSGVTILLMVAATSAAIYSLFLSRSSQPAIAITRHPKKVTLPTTVASPLTGLQVTPDQAKRPVTGVMIENSPDARPQSGLVEAGVVYEAIAEGGITRFMALYQEARPAYIGPVRSLRPYYLDWLAPFDASIAHVGGSPQALAEVRNGMKDLDQFFNSGSFWRQPTRAAPHNVYTSFDRLDALNQSKGYTSSTFISWPRKPDKPLAAPTARTVDLAISSYYFNVHYDYDAKTNSYLRTEGGVAHVSTSSPADQTGQQIHPKVVIALIIPYSIIDSSGHSGYATSGSGQLYVFQDGGVTQGTWSKASRSNQYTFNDTAGAPIKLDAGQTWLTALGASNMVSYKP